MKFKGMHYPVLISPSRVPELNAITANPDGSVFIGGAASLSAVEHALSELDGIGKDVEGAGGGRGLGAGGAGAARACVDMLRWFASTQIRNVACLAGEPFWALLLSFAVVFFAVGFGIDAVVGVVFCVVSHVLDFHSILLVYS